MKRSPLKFKPRARKCAHCREKFMPDRMGQVACSVPCAVHVSRTRQEVERKRQTREARQRIKPRSEFVREAQAAFNAWVRERDYDDPCISCGRFHEGQWHAGHYRTTAAAPELRFDPLNVHKQCMPCNTHKSGNLIEYRIRLVQKIGAEAVEALEGPHEPKHYTRDELQEIKTTHARMARQLKQARD